jgi:hypothetical protein
MTAMRRCVAIFPHIRCERMWFAATCAAPHLRLGRVAMSKPNKKREPPVIFEVALTAFSASFIFVVFTSLLNAYAP